MIFQNKDGTIVIINRKDYKDDKSYYNVCIQYIHLKKV